MKINASIAHKLVFQAVAISLVTILVSMGFVFDFARETIIERTSEQLQGEAAIRDASVENILNSRATHAHILADYTEIGNLLNISNSQQCCDKEFLEIIDHFEKLIPDAEIENIVISNGTGTVLFSLDRHHTTKDISENPYYVKAIHGENFAEFGASTPGNSIYAASPIVTETDDIIGTVMIVSGTQSVDDILLDKSGLGSTGEVYLVNYNHTMISESRFIQHVKYSQQVDTLGVTNCVNHTVQTVDTYPDYRGIPIFGATHCSDGFILLAEMDMQEMLEPILVLQERIILIGIIVIGMMAVVAFFTSRKISKPVITLADAARQIENGRFDVTTNINSSDEIGQLSTAFDSMAKRLQKQSHTIRQKEDVIKYEEDILLKFSDKTETDCVCFIDIVNSTKLIQTLSDSQAALLYETFLNEIAGIVRKYEGTVIKNMGDALLFTFNIQNPKDKLSIANALDCSIAICQAYGTISDTLESKDLPSVKYRISITYGIVRVASSSTSTIRDIFGSTVNRCSKINRLAIPNGIVCDGAMYREMRNTGNYTFYTSQKDDSDVTAEYGYDAYHVSKNTSEKQ